MSNARAFYIGKFNDNSVVYPKEGIGSDQLKDKLIKKCRGLGLPPKDVGSQVDSVIRDLQDKNVSMINGQGCITGIIVKVKNKNYLIQTLNLEKLHTFNGRDSKGCIGHLGGYSTSMEETYKKCFTRENEEEAGKKARSAITFDPKIYHSKIELGITPLSAASNGAYNIDAKIVLIRKENFNDMEECFVKLGFNKFSDEKFQNPVALPNMIDDKNHDFLKKVNQLGLQSQKLFRAKGSDDVSLIMAIPVKDIDKYSSLYDPGSLSVAKDAVTKLENLTKKDMIHNRPPWNASIKIQPHEYSKLMFFWGPYWEGRYHRRDKSVASKPLWNGSTSVKRSEYMQLLPQKQPDRETKFQKREKDRYGNNIDNSRK